MEFATIFGEFLLNALAAVEQMVDAVGHDHAEEYEGGKTDHEGERRAYAGDDCVRYCHSCLLPKDGIAEYQSHLLA